MTGGATAPRLPSVTRVEGCVSPRGSHGSRPRGPSQRATRKPFSRGRRIAPLAAAVLLSIAPSSSPSGSGGERGDKARLTLRPGLAPSDSPPEVRRWSRLVGGGRLLATALTASTPTRGRGLSTVPRHPHVISRRTVDTSSRTFSVSVAVSDSHVGRRGGRRRVSRLSSSSV